MNYWKWSNGETYYKSPRKRITQKSGQGQRTVSDFGYEEDEQTKQISYDSAQNAIAQSLAFTGTGTDDSFASINNDNNYDNNYDNDNINNSQNKREHIDNKISDREMISQRGTNPFSNQTSYVNDVVTRDMFLKPINTTQGRTKNQNKTENE
jgi:hypothetical protein